MSAYQLAQRRSWLRLEAGDAGTRLQAKIADGLNARGVATARGGRWQTQTVSNVLARSA